MRGRARYSGVVWSYGKDWIEADLAAKPSPVRKKTLDSVEDLDKTLKPADVVFSLSSFLVPSTHMFVAYPAPNAWTSPLPLTKAPTSTSTSNIQHPPPHKTPSLSPFSPSPFSLPFPFSFDQAHSNPHHKPTLPLQPPTPSPHSNPSALIKINEISSSS